MITPAISVLSALEGLNVATHIFEPYIIPITILILCALFTIQSKGTGGIGKLFGPVMANWFTLMGVLGFFGILKNPAVLVAFNPIHAVNFFATHGIHGIVILGAVFLVMTGGETLYADMGHFGLKPIRVGWFFLALPALLLNYLGQGALLLKHPEFAVNPFFHLAPDWALYPIIAMATVATVIASQAVISGVFSLTMAAVHFGYLPRLHIRHTSERQFGQIYVPVINWTLLAATIALVLGFQSSGALAAAYGIAVSLDMVITDIFLFSVTAVLWKWPKYAVIPIMGAFLLIDLAFFGANSLKIANGGWVPLVVASVCFTIMSTWWRGRRLLYERIRSRMVHVSDFLEEIGVAGRVGDTEEVEIAPKVQATRIPGTFVYLTGSPRGIPSALVQNFRHNRILHETIVLLTVKTVSTEATVSPDERLEVDELGSGFYRIIADYGFMEEPDVAEIFSRAKRHGIIAEMEDITFVVGRETIIATKLPGMALWREKLFALMSRNATNATKFFNVPREQVLEIGTQIEL
jgi:KUP system potassium uptake protein